MAYIICEKCRKYYKVEEGESLEDFELCRCGGNLKFVQNLDNYILDDSKPINSKQKSSENGLNRNYKIFIYSIIMLIVLDVIWALYLIIGTTQSLISFLIPIYMGYNLPKNKIVKYIAIFGVITVALETLLGGGVGGSSLVISFIMLIIWTMLFIAFGFVGNFIKSVIKGKTR